MAMRQSREYMLRQIPAGAINLKMKDINERLYMGKMILPAADRRRFTYDPSRDPDFYLADRDVDVWLSHLPKDLFPPVLHRFKVYNNTIIDRFHTGFVPG